jgi:hypothetical protein
MGEYAAQLGRTLDADLSAVQRQHDTFGSGYTTTADTASHLSGVSEGLREIMRGEAGEAAAATLTSLSADIGAISNDLAMLATAAESARSAIELAQQEYNGLPRGTVTPAERRELTQPSLLGAGDAGGMTPEILAAQRERAREEAAATALSTLGTSLAAIEVPQRWARDEFTIDDSRQDPDQQDGGSSGSGGPRGYASGGTGAVPGGTIGGYGVVAGGSGVGSVAPTWQPPVGSEVGVIGGGGSGPSAGSGNGGAVGPGWTGGSGSGIGGGHIPGTGDGSSSDGVVGGTVPGGSGPGGDFVGSGGAGGSGSGASALSGVGAGGLAGGLTVGGAALGGAGLNRLAGGGGVAGGGGGGGTGGLGGVGSAGGYGGYGASTGSAGGGTSGSALSGTRAASGLGQGSQAGAAGAGAAGQRAGGMMGGPMGGGAGGAGGTNQSKRRGASGLLAPDIAVDEGGQRPDLGAGAGAGGRDALAGPVAARPEPSDDEW